MVNKIASWKRVALPQMKLKLKSDWSIAFMYSSHPNALISDYMLIIKSVLCNNETKTKPSSCTVQQPFGGPFFIFQPMGLVTAHGRWIIISISNAKCNWLMKNIRDYVTHCVVCAQCAVHRLHAERYWIRKEQFLIRNNMNKRKNVKCT